MRCGLPPKDTLSIDSRDKRKQKKKGPKGPQTLTLKNWLIGYAA